MFKIGHLLLQRLLFGNEFGFFGTIDFSVYILLQIAVQKSLELGNDDFYSLLVFLNKSRNGLGGL
ncbi:MAG: hypothetical protein A3C81_00890 [Candidatus Yanofskybacteria bacterium RIFCSPHIGHO2_02_FULL_46_19]|uniref:Uncharacterized protein n=1 Tax=Candidatus Yanofskybacteria bacterium RIFCSPHIGHO2_02_FULL_46_19 TaxID=1802684 RepID=A0A1F8FTU4_9BACT|nr:MAG: hypothetical protein A3C81_00890 [Candidatus Yanofskybacteria bacterium RIFCSPHIGHO2_02_FULL_46_19]OGN26260.1 MAG: hypothetical protein A3B17_02770 [Candidatus Yanofskybacteria bacterium RIFCSPLOWO2_01_FULL_45_72]